MSRCCNVGKPLLCNFQGWKTRKRMRAMKRGIPTLQRSFRKQKQKREEVEALRKSQQVQETAMKLEKQRSFRHIREKQLHSLEIVPAGATLLYAQLFLDCIQ